MKAFRRLLKYVWPQWPRVTLVVTSALSIALLFSLSFATIIPLLKVVMNEEGVRGWVNRSVCGWRYGLNFYVPETSDFIADANNSIAYYLLVTEVKDKSLAQQAGLKKEDKIIGVGTAWAGDFAKEIQSSRLIDGLATTEVNSIPVQVKRIAKDGSVEQLKFQMAVPEKKSYIRWIQSLAGFVDPGQSKSGKMRIIIYIMILAFVVTFFRCLATFLQKYFGEKVVLIATARMREDVLAHVMSMPVGFFVRQGTSDTVSRMLRDIAQSADGISVLLGKALREPGKALAMLLMALWINWHLTLIFLTAAPIALLLGVTMGRQIKKAVKKSLAAWSSMLGRVGDIVVALRVVKVYNRQQYELDAYKRVNKKLVKRLLRVSKVDSASTPVLEILGMIGGSAAVVVGIGWVMNQNMEPSYFFLLLISLGVSADSFRKTIDVYNKLQMSNAAAERVFALLDSPVEQEKIEAIELVPMRNQIEFRNVEFAYPGSCTPALSNINLVIKAGTNVAIVGPNGSGKTTLANLVPRFYDPDKGQVLIDGIDIRDVTLYSLRNQIGMVTQNVVTFNDTIAANIAYGKENATQDEIVAAAKRAFAHEFVTPLPNGYGTVIGEQGSGLSGGQLQRLVIARAILKNPPILIFDEATSQIDADSEAKIHNAIEEVIRNRTTLVIAHRFSTIVKADQIVVMDKGRIVASGQHSEMIKSCSLYHSLYENQLIVSD
jgi:ATP-binding cassette, subfamily B, bacterial MsbA